MSQIVDERVCSLNVKRYSNIVTYIKYKNLNKDQENYLEHRNSVF